MVWFRLIFVLFSFSVLSNELNKDEEIFFNFIDLNNDKYISKKEADDLINLVFQLIDKNQDDKISLVEIEELKSILKNFQ